MRRSSFNRQQPDSPELKPIRPKLCDRRKGGCGSMFTPSRSMQKACSIPCGQAMGRLVTAKKAAKEAAQDKRQTKAQLEALKTIPQLKKEAQHAFNAAIRARDRLSGLPCICCGRVLRWDIPGGAVDAGHYRSTGSADNLRYNEDNCHAQLAECNRYGAGRAVDYRIGLLARIGSARVEALETNNTPVKWTREQLREIRDS